MKHSLRVLLIGRHFWPHGSIDSAGFLFHLACGLHRQGVHVEVLSPRYASSWPEQFTIREIPVHRPAAAPRSDWSMGRYVRHVTTWLRENAKSFDVLLVDAIREESTAAIEASRSLGCPTIVRCAGWGNHSDPQWWRTTRSARKCGVVGRMADAVIVKSAACQRELLVDGYAATRLERINNGFAAGPLRTVESRHAAQSALATIHGDLVTHPETPVVLCASRMTRDGGVNLLVRAARHLIDRYPDLRLWFLGDGPYRDWIYEYLRGEGVRSSIAMPGSFCDVQDVFAAADLFVQPDDDGLDFFLPSAVSAELPIVTVNNESTRAVIAGGAGPESSLAEQTSSLVQWCSGATSKLIRTGIMAVLEDLPARRSNASQLRRLLVRRHPQSETVQAYVELMQRVARQKSPKKSDSSIEAAS